MGWELRDSTMVRPMWEIMRETDQMARENITGAMVTIIEETSVMA